MALPVNVAEVVNFELLRITNANEAFFDHVTWNTILVVPIVDHYPDLDSPMCLTPLLRP